MIESNMSSIPALAVGGPVSLDRASLVAGSNLSGQRQAGQTLIFYQSLGGMVKARARPKRG
jgi:hypothetical protein